MSVCLASIILLNALLGWLLVHFISKFLIKSLHQNKRPILRFIAKKAQEELSSNNLVQEKINQLDLVKELEPFLDQRLEKIIQNMAAQIPMGEFFLAGSLGQKMKLKVREEIVKVLPELKEHLVKRMEQEFDLQELVKEKVLALDFDSIVAEMQSSLNKKINRMKYLAAAAGGLAGLFEVLTLFWFCL